MLLILTSSASGRLGYITRLLFGDLMGIEVRITTSQEEFSGYAGPKFCYAAEPMAEGLFLAASDLLFENILEPKNLPVSVEDGVPFLFPVVHATSDWKFDLFAASFYMVSRYEEYLHHKKDRFGRFPASESIAWKGKFLETPIVNIWAGLLEALIVKHFPAIVIRHPQYRYVPTIDIDHAWCYLGRSLTRTMGGLGRSVMQGRFTEVAARLKTLAGLSPDPFDNYDFIKSVHAKYGHHPLFFILFADYGQNDNNVTVTSKQFQKLVSGLDTHNNVGLHPSLSSNKHLQKLEDEFIGLSETIGRDVTMSRQHFLKLSLPRTCRTLIQLGITDDYSMGYAGHIGFRAGIAAPFPFFDLSRNEATTLVIHPVSLMDVTLKDYLRLNNSESLQTIHKVIRTIRSVNGEFVSLWHNESLGETGRWKGWRQLYEAMVEQASS